MPSRRIASRRTLAVVAVLLVVPLAALALAAILGVSFDAGRWRGALASIAGDALEREVSLEGQVRLTLGLRSALRIGGIRIANPPGFSTPEFASLGDVSAQVDLLPALRGRLRIQSLEAENVRVRLERATDGRFNWRFGTLAGVADAEAPRHEDDDAGLDLSVRIRQLALRSVAVEYRDMRSERSRYFDLDELVGDAPWNGSLKIAIRGRVEKRFPYRLTLEGGPARMLYLATEPWPFELDFEFVETHLHATGTADPRTGETQVDLGLGTANLAEVERLLETKLPKLGVLALAARMTHRDDAASLDIVRGMAGDSEVTGRLRFAAAAGRPRVSGELSIATFDLRPFLDSEPAPADKPSGFRELERQSLRAPELGILDADVKVTVGRWLGLPGEIRDARLAVELANGRLQAPIQATIAGVPLAGRLDFDGVADVPAFALELGATNSPLGDLAGLLTGLRGIEGTLGRFELRLAGRGDTLGALARNLDARLTAAAAKLTYGNVEGGRPVDLTLDSLDVSIPRGKGLQGTARGRLRGEAVTARLQGGDLITALRELRSRVELTLQGAGASARIAGVLARPETRGGTDLTFHVDGRRAGDLAAWLGTSPRAAAPLALQGRVRAAGDEWHVEDFKLKLGRSELAMDIHESGTGAKSFVIAAVRSPLIDVPELQGQFPDSAPRSRGSRTEIDIPILPRRLELGDADVGIGVERVVLARGELTNGAIAARLRGGRMEPSPFGATFAGVPFDGTLMLDLRGDVPEAAVAMSASKVDVGRMLARMRIAEDLDAQVDALKVQLISRGSRLGEMLQGSSLAAKLEGGSVKVGGPGRRVVAEIRLREAVLDALPGKPIQLRLDGALDETPVTIRLSSGTLLDFGQDSQHVPFSLTAESAGARLAIDGRVTLPMREATADLKLILSGDRLDSLNRLARTNLPPWGPWSIAGPLRITTTAYELPDLAVSVGKSRLTGRGRLDVSGDRPRLDVQVTAPRLQLDDFELAGWSAFANPAADKDSTTSAEALREKVKGAAAQTQALASAEVLRRFDADIDVAVEQVLSGADRLGDGRLRAQVTGGRAFLGPAEVNVPGGAVRLSLMYQPTEREVILRAGVFVERFDYGILARRLEPGTDAAGTFSMNFQLGSRAPTLATVMEHANGRIDFAVWPRNLRSGVFDLWAVNVFLALLPEVDPSAASSVNCAVGRFDLRDGKLTGDAILIDTSRMRVNGVGGVDFRDETLGFRLQPRAKDLQLFSLATPVQVTGTLTDFHVGPGVGDVLATIGRFLGSLVVIPLEYLGSGPIPRDGADVCTDPLRAPLTRGARRGAAQQGE
jgi:uncharacterized protein involved in outer membrane biogenesis